MVSAFIPSLSLPLSHLIAPLYGGYARLIQLTQSTRILLGRWGFFVYEDYPHPQSSIADHGHQIECLWSTAY
jgi:hypothetical protein